MTLMLLCPPRRRPAQFGWVDPRLAHRRFFEHAPPQAWALYLFLLTVADARGLSGYADHTLCQRLDLAPGALAGARAHLLRLGLIAYRPPLTQVLALQRPPSPRPPRRTDPLTARHHLQRLRQHLSGEYAP